MFRRLKKKNNINAETYFPSVKELPTISKKKCLKAILKAHKNHRTGCNILGTIDDDLKNFLEDKGYKVKIIINPQYDRVVEISFC